MAFHHTLFDFAFFVAPALSVALTNEEQEDLAAMEKILQRRKAELKLCGRTRSLALRIKVLQADILQLETTIADMRTVARYRSNV